MVIHLHVHSPYSFLDGGSSIEALVKRAAWLGMPALALTDHDNVAAAVKFTAMCTAYGIAPILGAELTIEDGSHLTLLATNREGYANLCRLITCAYTCGGRRTPALPWSALGIGADGGRGRRGENTAPVYPLPISLFYPVAIRGGFQPLFEGIATATHLPLQWRFASGSAKRMSMSSCKTTSHRRAGGSPT